MTTRQHGPDRDQPRSSTRRALGIALILFLLGIASSTIARAQSDPGPEPEPERPPARWAVLIGVDRYEDPEIRRCPNADADVRALRSFLINEAGWRPDRIALLGDGGRRYPLGRSAQPTSSPLSPTNATLGATFDDWLSGNVEDGDLVFIFFAGHAAEIPNDRRIATGPEDPDAPGASVLLLADTRLDALETTGFPLEAYVDPIAARSDVAILICLDTSIWGQGAIEDGPVGPSPSPNGTEAWLDRLTGRWPNIEAWLAADGRPARGASIVDPYQGLLAEALQRAAGRANRPNNLRATLGALTRLEPALSDQGFLARGDLDPNASFWIEPRIGGQLSTPPRVLIRHGHARGITDLVVSPNNQTLYSAGGESDGGPDSTVRAWNLPDWDRGPRALEAALSDLRSGVNRLALSPDGSFLIAGDNAGRILVHSLRDGLTVDVAEAEAEADGAIIDLAVLPGSRLLASRHQTGRALRLWTLPDPIDPEAITESRQVASDVDRIAVAELDDPEIPVALVAAIDDPKDGRGLLLFDRDGALRRDRPLAWPGARITALALDVDGSRLAVGDETGLVGLYELGELDIEDDPPPIPLRLADGVPVRYLNLDREDRLIAALADDLRVVALASFVPSDEPPADPSERPGRRMTLPVGDFDDLAFATSADGRWLGATLYDRGAGRRSLVVWNLRDALDTTASVDEPIDPWPLDLSESDTDARSRLGLIGRPAFTPDGRRLIVGDTGGALHAWDLPEGSRLATIPAHRGQLRGLSLSPNGDELIQIGQDGRARAWDLDRGVGFDVWPGHWSALIHLPVDVETETASLVETDDRIVRYALVIGKTTDGVPDLDPSDVEPGRVVVHERSTRPGRRPESRWVVLPTPPGSRYASFEPDPVRPAAQRLVASPGGRYLAAAGRNSLVVVWDLDPTSTTDAIFRLAQSPSVDAVFRKQTMTRVAGIAFLDADRLVIGFDDGSLELRDRRRSEPNTPPLWTGTAEALEDAIGSPVQVTALQARRFDAPTADGVDGRMAIGTKDGRLVTWDVRFEGLDGVEVSSLRPIDRRLNLDRSREIRGLRFTPDGRRLIAVGRDKEVWAYDLEDLNQRPPRFGDRHDEQINALVIWSEGDRIATASDDATVRFWDLDGARLLGTLTAATDDDASAQGDETGSEWIAVASNGRFDASIGGLRRVAWIRQGVRLDIDQLGDAARTYGLVAQMASGAIGEPPPELEPQTVRPPRIAFLEPPARTDQRTLRLALESDRTDLDGRLRLFHDGVLIRGAEDLRVVEDPNTARAPRLERRGLKRWATEVRLHDGDNRFHALATNPGGVDGRTREIVVRYDGTPSPPRLFVLAIGVDRSEDPETAPGIDALVEGLRDRTLDDRSEPTVVRTLTDAEARLNQLAPFWRQVRREVRPVDVVAVLVEAEADFDPDTGAIRFRFDGPNQPSPLSDLDLRNNLARIGTPRRLLVLDLHLDRDAIDDQLLEGLDDHLQARALRDRTTTLLAVRAGPDAHDVRPLPDLILRAWDNPKALDDSGADSTDDGIVTSVEMLDFVVEANGDANDPGAETDAIRILTTRGVSAFPIVRRITDPGASP